MSKIVLKCGKEWLKAENLKILKEIIELGFSEITDRIKENKPIAEFSLFLNDHEEIEDRLIKVITFAEERNLEISLFEISENENFTDIKSAEKVKISSQILQNIFESSRETRKQLDDDDLRFG